jgi:ABC-2 type transport system ATP-binding protein
VIEAHGLTKRYGQITAVDHLSFDVRPGVVTGFLGPNGSGKSTTMRLILGLDAADHGTVTINGRAYHDLPFPIREVGALPEARTFHPARSARAHLQALAASNAIPPSRVDQTLQLVGLASASQHGASQHGASQHGASQHGASQHGASQHGAANRKAGQLSLGMAQRLGIAAALLGDPPILIFDEPVNGLDPEGIRWIRNLMRSLAAEGRTVFVSSHLIAEMALTAERLIVIGAGRLLADTTVAELSVDNASLEDAFLALTSGSNS